MDSEREQKVWITVWYLNTNSYATAVRKFRAHFGRHANLPSERQTKRYAENLLANGSIFLPRRGAPVTATGDENVETVKKFFDNDPHESTRRASAELDISQPSVVRILKACDYHPYKLRVVQELTEEDKAHRKVFAEAELQLLKDDPDSFYFLFSTDEANFHLHGLVNRHNCRYWSESPPTWYEEQPLHSPKVIVWGGVWKGGAVGPFFFDGNVNGANYLKMLNDFLVPYLRQKRILGKIRFQQDGAPPHWSRDVRAFLDRTFPRGWIGRGSNSVSWPARSPDLSPCDFYLWGTIKDKVYKSKPRTMEDLKTKIKTAFDEIDSQTIHHVMENYVKRLQKCVTAEGAHVEL